MMCPQFDNIKMCAIFFQQQRRSSCIISPRTPTIAKRITTTVSFCMCILETTVVNLFRTESVFLKYKRAAGIRTFGCLHTLHRATFYKDHRRGQQHRLSTAGSENRSSLCAFATRHRKVNLCQRIVRDSGEEERAALSSGVFARSAIVGLPRKLAPTWGPCCVCPPLRVFF